VKVFAFFKVLKSKNERFLLLFSPFCRSAKVPFYLFLRKSVEHVMGRNKATNRVTERLILMMT